MTTTELVQYLQSYVQARKQYEENAQMERDLDKEIQARRRAPKKKARDDTFGDIFLAYHGIFRPVYDNLCDIILADG